MKESEKIECYLEAEKAKAKICWESNFPTEDECYFPVYWVGWLESGIINDTLFGLKVSVL